MLSISPVVGTPAGHAPKVATALTAADRRRARRARWGVGRMAWTVPPGLYAVGSPGKEAPVLASANYGMSFDALRSVLGGRDAWILVLDTKGINVWCAAGKGTFGTDELVRRIEAARLAEVVTHRRIVVPQLGAPGVAAHAVKERSGFRVAYGPIRAADLPAFLDAGMKATPDMRRKRFPFGERAALVPMEIAGAAKAAAIAIPIFVLLAGFGRGGYLENLARSGVTAAVALLAAAVGGAVLTPLLLPWLPGRAFSLKGAWPGLAVAAGLFAWRWEDARTAAGILELAGLAAIAIAVSAFLAMGFTGASTYTSPSGVKREMRVAVPVQIAAGALGAIAWIAGRFVA